MLAYISRRFLQTIPVLIGVTLLIFILIFILPGDPVRMWAPKGADKQMLANVRAKWGLNKPWYVQYANYMSHLVQGDFGDSFRFKRPVSDILGERYPNSIRLALVAIVLEVIFGLLAGIISAIKRYSFWDVLVTLSSTILVAVPVFWLGLLLQLTFGLKLGWLPVGGMGDGSLSYYILPSVTLAAVSLAFVARFTRSSLLEVMRQDYIRTTRAKGLPERVVIYKHALKNALIPVVTFVGLDFGALIGGAVLTETVFAWPGIGRQIYFAVLQRDYPVVMGGVVVLVLVFIVLNLLVDVSYAFLDPRIRYGRKEL